MPKRPLEDLFLSVMGGSRDSMATRDPGRVTAFARRLHVLADGYISERRAESDFKVECKQGCDACCHRIVEATFPEALAATSYVMATFDEAKKEALLQRIDELDEENQGFWRNNSDLANAPCPFLEDHACSIYDARPLSCRALNSADASACARLFLTGEPKPVPHDGMQSQVASLNRAVVAGARDASAVSGTFELGPTVARLLRDPSQAYRMDGYQQPLEKTKLSSEWNADDEKITNYVWKRAADPLVKSVRDGFLSGEAAQAVKKLEGMGGPFKAIFDTALPFEYSSQQELDEWWVRWNKAVDRLAEAELPAQETFEVAELFTSFAVAYTGKDVRPGMEKFMGALHRCANEAFPQFTAPFERERKPGKFRLGYISPRIKNFNGSRWALGWLTRHSQEIETYVINLIPKEDQVSAKFRRAADYYFHLPFPVQQVAGLVRELDLDALIFTDVGMEGQSLQLASLRLARKQFNAWGHPVTSGSPTMDFYISSEMMEPENGQDHYSEALIKLPGSGLCYPRSPIKPSAKTHAELGVPSDGFLLFCQLSFKQIPQYDSIFREVLNRSKKPVVFLCSPLQNARQPLQERMKHPNAIFLPYLPAGDYFRVLQLADVSLDTPAWNGGNTTIEALSLGTPVVSLSGQFMRGRHALAFLPLANVGGLVARDEAEYVELSLNAERRADIMRGLNVDALYEDETPVHALDAMLLG